MNSVLAALSGITGLVLLYYGAEWLVKGGCAIAARCRVSPLIIGLTLVAFGTSAPELFVSSDAALNGLGDMAVGNVVGSNICNIALILGLSSIVAPLTVNPQFFKIDVPLMVAASVVAAVLGCFFGGFGRLAGLFLTIGIVLYTVLSIVASRRATKSEAAVEPKMRLGIAIVAAIGGLGALVAGSKGLLFAAVYMARALNVPESVIALTIVAVGTSLPELATSLVAAIKGQTDISIGNIVGSNIFNILGILGIASLLKPIASPGIDIVDMSMMVFTAVLLWPIMKTGHKITRKEGVLLLVVYVGYTAWLVSKVV